MEISVASLTFTNAVTPYLHVGVANFLPEQSYQCVLEWLKDLLMTSAFSERTVYYCFLLATELFLEKAL